jgi:FKBP-type peptidyl-prolyl cis-trans isomerase FkpA
MATKKEYATRFGLFTIAMLFLITSVGFSILVIWQNRQQKNLEKAALESSQTDSSTEVQTSPETEATKNEGETVLQGTKLQNFTTVAKIDSLQSIDLVPGTGAEVKAGDTVTAHYTGAVAADGTIFQSSHDGPNQPVPFSLNGVIKGWTDGVPGMKVGGTRRLLIPAAQAYAGNPPSGSGIPVNADLVFDIEIVKIGE